MELSTLTPEGLDEQLPVWLSQVFEPQQVRAVPVTARRFPHLELPRDLWRRLVESGDLDLDELPADVDQEQLQQTRRDHLGQPPRPVFDVLADNARRGRVALLGDPGSGKSSLLAYLALALAGDELPEQLSEWTGWLPILVELREYADPTWRTGRWADGTLLDYLDHAEQHHRLGFPRDQLEDYLHSDGRAVVMFDGLDELFDAAQREQTARAIAAFTSRFSKATVLVTSRPIGYRRGILDAAGFALHTVEDLDRDQIDTFVERWYRLAYHGDPREANARATRLQAALDRSSSAAVLAGNPLLLTILSIIGRRRELPRERHRVYEHAVSVLVQHWDPSRHLHDNRVDLDETDRRRLLEQIAASMQRADAGIAGNHIHYEDLIAEFRRYLTDVVGKTPDSARSAAASMIDQLRERNFILSRYGPGLYGFVHRAFLEYCAAAAITYQLKEEQSLTSDDLAALFCRYAADPAWSEVLLLLAGMLHPNVLRLILDKLTDYAESAAGRVGRYRGHHLLLALRCLAETRTLTDLEHQARRITAELVHHLLIDSSAAADPYNGSAHTDELLDSVESLLIELGPSFPGAEVFLANVAKLMEEVASADLLADMRLRQLIRIESTLVADSDSARLALIERASRTENAAVREEVLRALVARWPDQATRTIVERAIADELWGVRQVAVDLLTAEWPDEATRITLERVVTDDHWAVAQAAAFALSEVWPGEATRTLVESLVTDGDADAVQLALDVLSEVWPDEATRRLVSQAITDPREDVRAFAVESLVKGWPDEATRMLVERALTDPDESVRSNAVEFLVEGWPDESTRMLVEQALTDPHEQVRQDAVRVLAAKWPDEATRVLLVERAATDQDIEVRQLAMMVLKENVPDEPTRALLIERATKDEHEIVRSAALEFLTDQWPDSSTRALLAKRAITDPDIFVRRWVVKALGARWPDEATRALLVERVLTDNEGGVRHQALRALAEGWPDDGTRSLAERALSDQDVIVRLVAIRVLVREWPDGATQSRLQLASTDQREEIRSVAEQALRAWPDGSDPESASQR